MSSCKFFILCIYRQLLKEYMVVLVQLAVLDITLWLITWASNISVDPVSRRFANLTYILWTVSCRYVIQLCIQCVHAYPSDDLYLSTSRCS